MIPAGEGPIYCAALVTIGAALARRPPAIPEDPPDLK
jgi:hypothetical protein